MNLLDLYEGREPHQQAIDRLEQRRIADLEARMDDCARRGDVAGFRKAKEERDSYHKVKTNEGQMKQLMHKDAERMSRAEFCKKYGNEDWVGEFWDNVSGPLDEAGIGHDIADKKEKIARATPQSKVGAVASTVKNAAKWLAGKGGPGKEGPTYESAQKKNSKKVNEDSKPRDLAAALMLKKAHAAFPIAKDDAEALALWIADKEQRDVNRLEKENEQEEAMIARIIDQLQSKDLDEHGGGGGGPREWHAYVRSHRADEGWSDAIVAQRTGRPRTPYSIYIKGKKWKDFENEDHAENVANKLRAKFKAEGRDPSVITIAPTDYDKGMDEAANPAQQAAIAIAMKKAHKKPKHMDEAEDRVDPIIIRALERLQPGLEGSQLYSAAKQALALEFGLMKARGDATFIHYLNQLQNIYSQRHSVKEDIGSWIVYDPVTKEIRKRFKTHTAGKSYAQTHKLGFASSEYYFDNIKPAVAAEGMTDFQKRRQRERDVDAGKPVARQRPSKQTDYQRRRAQDKKDVDLGEEVNAIEENLKKWFKEKWVRFGPDGKIRGDCARGSESEGKPKCLPQSKAHALGKKGRASAAAKKRREDPNPERRGPAKNVATKVKEDDLDENCWKGYHKEGTKELFGKRVPNCVKNESTEGIPFNQCPKCGGEIVHESQLAEKQDACYHKVKSRYKVWPSAYASGALVQCRKKGAANWGNKSKNESADQELDEKWSQKYKNSINCANPKGFSQKAHCAGRKKNEGMFSTLGEDNEARDAVESAIIRRILVAHKDLLMKFGPQKVMDATAAVADNHSDVEEIGTSDVSAYVHEVERYLAMNH